MTRTEKWKELRQNIKHTDYLSDSQTLDSISKKIDDLTTLIEQGSKDLYCSARSNNKQEHLLNNLLGMNPIEEIENMFVRREEDEIN